MSEPQYLQPYLDAARRHGPGFQALLWSSPQTQAARFASLVRICDFAGHSVLDAGCGHGDFFDYLTHRGWIGKYIGLEAIHEFADIAQARVAAPKVAAPGRIIRGDFVQQPSLLDQDADIILFCGSLNTLNSFAFHLTLRAAAGHARHAVAFNFLSSGQLAAAEHLTWHSIQDVVHYAGQIGRDVKYIADYMEGDCTLLMRTGV